MSLDRILEVARKYPDRVMVLPLGPNLQGLARDRPGVREAYVQVSVPDELVKNLRGDEERRDAVFMIQVPRELWELGQTRIILPEDRAREVARP